MLFDTGGDGPTLPGNMEILGIDPTGIQTVLLSHIHGDHVDGLDGLLATGVRPTIYVPPSFPSGFNVQEVIHGILLTGYHFHCSGNSVK